METVRIKTIDAYNRIVNQETLHPLVSVINLSNAPPMNSASPKAASLDFYAVFLKEDDQSCIIKYGRNKYDYQQGTLVFTAPDQVMTVDGISKDYKPAGYALLFHPDLIRGTSLGKNINDYKFFFYEVHEALHLSKRERQLVIDCFKKIKYELSQRIDKHSKSLIVANIELFLNYCVRFYDRQFITRDSLNRGAIEKFEKLLHQYLQSQRLKTDGMPSVAFCASELNLSANYFGDLIKKETGRSAQELIHARVMELAKEKVFDQSKSISEISYELGFKYPQHFTRFFKVHEGISPNEYRNLN